MSSFTRLPVGVVSRQGSSCPVDSGRVVFAPCKTYRRLRCQFVVIHSQCHSGLQSCVLLEEPCLDVGRPVPRSPAGVASVLKKSRSRRQRNMKPEAVRRSAGHSSTRQSFASFIVCRLLVGAPGSRWRAFGFRGARPGWRVTASAQDASRGLLPTLPGR